MRQLQPCSASSPKAKPACFPPEVLSAPAASDRDWLRTVSPLFEQLASTARGPANLPCMKRILGDGRPLHASRRRGVPHLRMPRSCSAKNHKPFFKPLALSSLAPGEAHFSLWPGG